MEKRRSKWRWVGWGLGVVVLALGVGVAGLWWGVRGEPGWYREAVVGGGSGGGAGGARGAGEVDRLAREAEDQLVLLRNWAGATAAAEARAARGGQGGKKPAGEVPAAGGRFEVRVTGEQMTALLARWAVVNGRDQALAKFVADPVVVVHEGRVVVAGRATEELGRLAGVGGVAGGVLSLHFSAGVEGQVLRVRLERVMAGRVGVPVGAVRGELEKAVVGGDFAGRVARWKQEARLNERGTANDSAGLAALGRLIQAVGRERDVEAVGFVPVDVGGAGRSLPVWVREVLVEGEGVTGAVVVVMEAVPAGERGGVVGRVKE